MKRSTIVTDGKRPAFMFYTKDYMGDAALRLCSVAARGLWMDMLCLMHGGNPYGCLTVATQEGDRAMRPAQLCKITGIKPAEGRKLLAELEANNVFSWGMLDSNGELHEQTAGFSSDFHGKNAEVSAKREQNANETPQKFTLGNAPEACIFSRRMVRDHRLLLLRKETGATGGNPNLLRDLPPKDPGSGPRPSRPDLDNPKDNPSDNPRDNHEVKGEVKYTRANAFAVAFAVASASRALGSSSPCPTLQVEPSEGDPRGTGQAGGTETAAPSRNESPDGWNGSEPARLSSDLNLSCPHTEIIDLYTATLVPQLPAVLRKLWTGSEGYTALAHRWEEGLPDHKGCSKGLPDWMTYASRSEGLAAWQLFFDRVAASELLTGKKGKWRADLRWLVKKANFVKVVEGRYLDSQYTRRTPALDRFIAAYPRRGDDPDTIATTWHALDLENATERVFDGLTKWIASAQWTEDGGKYIPSAARWLRARQFEEAPPAAGRAPTGKLASNVHPFPARRTNNALWAEPVNGSSRPEDTGDWRAIQFPGGMYFLSEDALMFDEDIAKYPALVKDFYAHGRIAKMDAPPERVRLMAANFRAGQIVKPATPLRDEELPVFPPDALSDHMEDVG